MDIKSLHKLFLTCNSISTDTRTINKNDMFFALTGENFNGNEYADKAIEKGAKYCIIDDGKYESKATILVDNVLETLQKLATFHRQFLDIPILALTGSNGKTTTKELINIVLSKKYSTSATIGNLNNHIGVPLTLLSMTKETEIGIVEMGANHLKEIEFLSNITLPDFGYITNFGKAHLEGFGGLKGVIKGKSELYDHLKHHNKLIFVNEDDRIQIEQTKGCNVYSFSESKKTSNVHIQLKDTDPFVKLTYKNIEIQSKLIGAYNFKNISAAIAIGNYFKVQDQDIKLAIESYTPSNNRSQIIHKKGNKIIMDAYNANPTSMNAAIHSLERLKDQKKMVFLGDMFELGKDSLEEHQNIVDLLSKSNLDAIFIIGEHFNQTKHSSDNIFQFDSFDDLILHLSNEEFENSTILIKGSRGMAMERILDVL